MTVTPYQPTLPPEGAFTDAEIDFIESSPPGLFPDNQDSNFGFIVRKTWTDRVQELIDQLDTLYSERFIVTSTEFLDEWERMAGVPTAPTGLDPITRRAIVLGRVRKGPFTRALRRSIVENYIGATFGTPAAFDVSGISLTAGGVPLYAGAGTVEQMYEIVEDVPNYLYHIYIDSAFTPAAGMIRELTRATPAGISFDISYVPNAAPRLYWKLNDPVGSTSVVDLSQFAHPGTSLSGITFGVRPVSTDPKPSAQFASGGSYIRSAYAPFVVNSSRTFMGWGYRLATTDQDTIFTDQNGAGPLFYIAAGSEDVAWRSVGSNQQIWTAAWTGLNQWVHWALTYNDSTKVAELFINGISKGTKTLVGAYSGTGNFQLGLPASTSTFNGEMRDVAVYERILTPAEIQSYAHGFTLP